LGLSRSHNLIALTMKQTSKKVPDIKVATKFFSNTRYHAFPLAVHIQILLPQLLGLHYLFGVDPVHLCEFTRIS